MVSVEQLSIGYGSCALFSSLSFKIKSGEVVALMGSNGIGKSTLLRTLSGLQKPLSGMVKINESNIGLLTPTERSRLVSVVTTERLQLDAMSVIDFIALGRSPYTSWTGKMGHQDLEVVNRTIGDLGISHLSNRYYHHLSDGEKQLCNIARAVVQQSPLIVLDEPTAFLDYKNKRAVLVVLDKLAKEQNKCILFSTHDVEVTYRHATKFIVLQNHNDYHLLQQSNTTFEQMIQMLLE